MDAVTPTIRRYSTGEEASIWRVYYEATRQCFGKDYHPDLINRWAPADQDMKEWSLRLQEKNPFVAAIDGSVVAFAELEPNGHVDYFYCLPEWQGKGIGKALLRQIEIEALQIGLGRLFAEVSVTAKEFFLSRGFVVTEARNNIILGHSAPNFVMIKSLAYGAAGASAAE